MGPIFVHQQKKFETYYCFASSLVGLKSSLRKLMAFGTDGEKALSTAFSTVFDNATHCHCFLHFKGNLESKLREFNIPKHMQVEFLLDIFGDPFNAEDGLVDADSDEDFNGIVSSLQKIWNDREMIYNNPPQFYEWFITNCKADVQKTMLKEHRIKAGLGNPPEPFYTNDVESQNQVIKHQMNYKAEELPKFISMMGEMMVDQRNDIEKAVASIGEYRLKHDYQNLAIDARKFFQMSEKQRERVVKAFFSSPLNECIVAELVEETNMSEQHEDALMLEQYEEIPTSMASGLGDTNVLYQLQIPPYVADKVWSESAKLLNQNDSVCLSPGCRNQFEWLVQSTDLRRKSPYFVECCQTGQIVCEQNCSLFKCSKICAHIITVARKTNQLENYITWMNQQKEFPASFSKLAAIDMPKSSGKKANTHRKASQKHTMKQIKQVLDGKIGKYKYRVHPSESEISANEISRCDGFLASLEPAPSSAPPPLYSMSAQTDYSSPPPLIPSVAQNISLPYSPVVYAPITLPGQPTVTLPSQPTVTLPGQQTPSYILDTHCSLSFHIVFVNISRCTGCGVRNLRSEDGKPHPPPYNLCLQHKEYVVFANPHTGSHQMSSDLRNVYYHAHRRCVEMKHPNFDLATDLKIYNDVKDQLSVVHLEYIRQEFGISMI